jgi:hypothetical protein
MPVERGDHAAHFYVIEGELVAPPVRQIPPKPRIAEIWGGPTLWAEGPGEIARGNLIPSGSIEFKLHRAGVAPDFLPTNTFDIRLVSERWVQVMSSAQTTGWEVREVNLSGSTSKVDSAKYVALIIHGRCGPLSPPIVAFKHWPNELSPETRVTLPAQIDPSQWDGSDLFMSDLHAYLFCTPRVKRIAEEAGLTNMRFVDSAELVSGPHWEVTE